MFMSHFLLFYYILVVLIGFIALAVSLLGTIQSGIAAYRLLILQFAAFTFQVGTVFVRQYLYTNVTHYSFKTATLTYVLGSILISIVVVTGIIYFHHIFLVKFRRIRNWASIIVMSVSIVAYTLPGALRVDSVQGVMILGPSAGVGGFIYMVLFAYLVLVGLIGSKQDRPVRELILIWSLQIFGTIGFLESLLKNKQTISTNIISLSPKGNSFFITTIPYIAFGIVLIYYFGTYVLTERRTPNNLNNNFVKHYSISPREQEVIQLMNMGLSNREIAEKLFVSIATVKTHAHNSYEKTGAKSRYELFHLTNNSTHL